MSDRDTKMHSDGCGADVAAYALGALEPEEAAAFVEHLNTCSVCREELAEFQEVVEAIPQAVPRHQAPSGLRARVLGEVEAESSPPLRERQSRTRFGWALAPQRALALGAALAVLVVGVVVGLELASPGSPGSHVYAAQVTGSGSAHVTVSGGRAELTVQHFDPPPAGEIYEVWLSRPHQAPTPTTALFSVTSQGDADVVVPGDLRNVRLIMVTPEPAGGTRVPTHPAVIRAQLT